MNTTCEKILKLKSCLVYFQKSHSKTMINGKFLDLGFFVGIQVAVTSMKDRQNIIFHS